MVFNTKFILSAFFLLTLIFAYLTIKGNKKTLENISPFENVFPNCQPKFKFPTFPLEKNDKFLDVLHLFHELVFDGENFFGKIQIVEFGSYLIYLGNDEFEWRTIEGNVLQSKGLQNGDNNWIFERGNDQECSIYRSDESEIWKYKDSMPKEWIRNDSRYEWIYDSGKIVEVKKTFPFEKSILKVSYNCRNHDMCIIFGDSLLKVDFNRGKSIKSIFNQQNEILLEIKYTSGLVNEVISHGYHVQLRWGSYKGLFLKGINSLPPVIVSDGRINYNTIVDGVIMKVHFMDTKYEVNGSWILNTANGVLQY